jgi:putative protein-disulfide isomerase
MQALIYCYDPYCGWCYGFSNVMKQVDRDFGNLLHIEVLSGGMILPDKPVHISHTASYIQKAYQRVEAVSGVKFGEDYLWHINNPDKSDWYPHSEKPSVALAIVKDKFPEKQVAFASDLQYALHFEGRDLTDDEAYRHLLAKYDLNEAEFYNKLHDKEWKEKAYYEFALVKQLKVTGFPCLLFQVSDTKFFLLARGFTGYDQLKAHIEQILSEELKSM